MTETEYTLLTRLGELLRNAIRQSWARAVAQHADEHIYAYVLYTEPLLGYAVPSFNSEEALARIAGDEDEREELRWSPPDWEYHLENKQLFDKVQSVLEELDVQRDYDDDTVWERRWRVFIDSLLDLDHDSLFGTGEVRNALTVNIMWGDQDLVSHVQSARELNPKESYLRFARAQLDWLHDWQAEIDGRRSAYKEEAITRIKGAIDMVIKDMQLDG
ncbi:MAG: DUF4303 domain-containing protein [Cyanobacteria bacterium P01_A01_bin.40]